MQIWHGSADTNLNQNNYQEELKQWTSVFGVRMWPTATHANYPEKNYASSNYVPDVNEFMLLVLETLCQRT
jgi:acetylxylan esterase